MPEVPPLPLELSRSVAALACSLVAAARTWTMYPLDSRNRGVVGAVNPGAVSDEPLAYL